jgi:SAM-dependent methyltransferase
VEAFLAILYASAALRRSLRDGDGDGDASSRRDGVATVVDFGCGTGNLLLPLAALHPSVTFVGVDVNPRSIALLLERAKAARLRNVSAETGLIESYRGPAFDVALALHVCGEGTDAAMLQAQARNAAFVVAPCCVGKLKDGGLRSIEALKRDAGANMSDAFVGEDGAAARFSVIHPRSAWMRGRVQRPAYLGLAAAADWSGHDGVRAEEADASLARLPRAAKAAVEADRAASAAEAGFGVRLMKMLARDAGLKNDLIVGFPSGKDPMGERKAVRGPNLHSTNGS